MRGDVERALFLRLILRAVRFHFDIEKMLDRRNDDLLGIEEQLALADHRRVKKDIRDVFLCSLNHGPALVRTGPGNAIIPFAIGCEVKYPFARRIGLHALREDVFVLVATKLQSPTLPIFIWLRRKHAVTSAEVVTNALEFIAF